MKEVIHNTQGLTVLMTDGHFVAISEWRNMQHRYIKDEHDSAAGDYEPIQRDKRALIEVKQRTETLVWLHNIQDKADYNLQ